MSGIRYNPLLSCRLGMESYAWEKEIPNFVSTARYTLKSNKYK